MPRSLLSIASLLLTSAATAAQQGAVNGLLPAPAPRNAGIYHAASGTWSHFPSTIAMLGSDVLYDNTCTIGYYFGLDPGESLVDSGRLPSPTSPPGLNSLPGTSTLYPIDGFQLADCTGEPLVDLQVSFYQCYEPCSDATLQVPDASFVLTGFPGIPGSSIPSTGPGTTASVGCWVVTIDLSLTSQAFPLQADCNGYYGHATSGNNFGWSYEQLTPEASGVPPGPYLAGDPWGLFASAACPYGDGTVWSQNSNPGTGLGSSDVWEEDMGGAMTGCWFFAYPKGLYGSFYMRLHGDASGPPSPGVAYCPGDGSGTPCPCGNDNIGTIGLAGCAFGGSPGGARLIAQGTASVTSDDVVLAVSHARFGQPGPFFRADNATAGDNGSVFGDGLRCAGGNLVRLGVVTVNAAGLALSNQALGSGLVAGDVRRYQFWFRVPIGTPCGTGFNLTNGYEIAWAQ